MSRNTDALLRRVLRRPEPPSELCGQLKENLRHQVTSERAGGLVRERAARVVSMVVLAVVAGLLWPQSNERLPGVIAAARAHAADEAPLHGMYAHDLSSWLHSIGAAAAPEERLVMFKNCVVAGVEAKHLRLRLDGGSTADLLVNASGQWGHLLDHGEESGWLVAHPGENVSVIVLYESNDAPAAAQALEFLFPEVKLST